MRRLNRVAGLCVLVSFASRAWAGEPQGKTATTQPSVAWVEQHQRETAWFRRNLVDAYAKVGRHDAKWDKAAIATLELAIDWRAEGRRRDDVNQTLIFAGRDAVERDNTTDPLVRLILQQARGDGNTRGTFLGNPRLVVAADLDMRASGYAPLFRAEALAAMLVWSIRTKNEAPKRLADAEPALAAVLAELAHDPGVPFADVGRLCHDIERVYANARDDRKVGWDVIEKAMGGTAGLSAVRLATLRGQFLVDYAWDARGYGWADTVTEQGARQMAARLAQARIELSRAADADPLNALAPTSMIQVCVGEGAAWEEMERWYARAMRADPGNLDASGLKLNYLAPKWHGTAADELAFGRECLRAGNWAAGQPFVLPMAIAEVGRTIQDDAERRAFYERPEVWADVRAVYEPYLREHPDSQMRRAAYASWAYRCGHTDVVMLNYPLIRAGLPYDAIAPSTCTAIEELIKDAKGQPATK